MTITLTVTDAAAGCAPLAGAAVYLWQCDREGRYSMYSPGVTSENYLRGVQVADAGGRVSFTTVFPGCYTGRWPHAHFEVYPSLDKATDAAGRLATSQIAFPKDVSGQVYATDGYANSARTLSRLSLDTDMVFRDGWQRQLGTMTGSVTGGLTAVLNVPV